MLNVFLVIVLFCSCTTYAETIYVHGDILGSPVVETNSSGTVVSRSHYKPFGDVLEGMKKGVGYTGHLNDKDLGLTYMQARYYDPVIGRFYSNDPVGSVTHLSNGNLHGFNRYTYANNNPYKYTDPDGRVAKLVKAAFNVVHKASRNGWNFKKAGKEEIANFVDNAATLADGQFTADDVYAAIDIVTGFGQEAKNVKQFASKRAAFRQAKRDAGIPTSQTHNTHTSNLKADSNDTQLTATEFDFGNGKKVQDHPAGHTFNDGGKREQSHFNNHGTNGTKNHYDYPSDNN